MDRSGRSEPEPFVRRRLRPHVEAYSAGGPTSEKTLVVCFTGIAGRLFVPIPVFLQHLAAARFDVLVLRDPSRRGYRAGLEGASPGFPSLVDEVGRLTDRRAYRSVVTYGTSGGGLPALLAAARLGLDRGVSVSGRDPGDPRWREAVGCDAEEWLRSAGPRTSFLLVHASDSERDVASARIVAGLVRAEEFVVRPAAGERVGHNAVFPLLLRGRLREFLDAALVCGQLRDAAPLRPPG